MKKYLLAKLIVFLLLLCSFTLTSCSSVPISTMLKMSQMSTHDVVEIDPNEISVKVITPADIEVAPGKSTLSIGYEDLSANQTEYEFTLEIIGREDKKKGVFRRKKLNVTTLKLTDQAIKDFVNLQQDIKKNEYQLKSCTLGAYTGFKPNEKFATEYKLKMSIEVKLNENQGYFTLIDDAKIKMKPKEK